MLDEFQELGVKFVSIHDQIDLSTASGRLMLHIIAAFAEFERALIRERTVLGLVNARAKGKRLGRPLKRDDATIKTLRGQGLSYTEIQKRLNISRGAIYRALKPVSKTSSNRAAPFAASSMYLAWTFGHLAHKFLMACRLSVKLSRART